METNTVRLMEVEDPATIVGGDDSLALWLMYGLAFAGGVAGSGGLLAVAAGVGAILIRK